MKKLIPIFSILAALLLLAACAPKAPVAEYHKITAEQAKERLEEDRYRKLDHLLRQQQALRKEASKSGAGHYLRKLFGETT